MAQLEGMRSPLEALFFLFLFHAFVVYFFSFSFLWCPICFWALDRNSRKFPFTIIYIYIYIYNIMCLFILPMMVVFTGCMSFLFAFRHDSYLC